MHQYHTALQTILDHGTFRPNRTGTPTIGVFGLQSRYPLGEGFPLVTTKKMFMRGIVHEILWFLNGSTNIKPLVDNNVNIWNDWPLRRYNREHPDAQLSMDEFVARIKTDPEFYSWGELGPVYGSQWRRWPSANGPIDQIAKLMHDLKHNPYGRRHIVSAWNPAELEEMEVSGLPPCHCLFQFNVRTLELEERRAWAYKNKPDDYLAAKTAIFLKDPETEYSVLVKQAVIDAVGGVPEYHLDCQLYQRSCDFFLGVPFNIAAYSLLTHMIAHQLNMVPGDFVHTYGDAHIYTNHIDQVKQQLQRDLRPLPTLEIVDGATDIFSYTPDMFMLKNYDPHPAISGKVSV